MESNKSNMVVKERNPLDWYSLTESANSILNGLIALTSTEHMNELDKPCPDQNRIAELLALRDEVLAVLNDTTIFFSLDQMEEVIQKYSPILLAEKRKLQI